MTNPADKVREETKRFRDALPSLMKSLAGRWVVFRDGKVVADFASESEAYESAIDEYGAEGGFVVACVVVVDPEPINAHVLFA